MTLTEFSKALADLSFSIPSVPASYGGWGTEAQTSGQGAGVVPGGQNLLPRLIKPRGHSPGAICGHPEPPSVLPRSRPGQAARPGHSQGPLIAGPLQAAFSFSLSVGSFQKKWNFKARGRAGLSARFHKDLGIQRNEGRRQLEPGGGLEGMGGSGEGVGKVKAAGGGAAKTWPFQTGPPRALGGETWGHLA